MLNALCRYAPVVTDLGDGEASVLDVGSGPFGLAQALPERRFAGVDIEFLAPPTATMVPVRMAPGPLPFADAAFDVVISLDALEHVPPPARPGFVAELCRVSADRVLLSCPVDEGEWIDQVLRE